MTFKKFLRTKNTCSAQASLEYFIIFTVIALLTLLSLSTFREEFISVTQGIFFREAVGEYGLDVENIQDVDAKEH